MQRGSTSGRFNVWTERVSPSTMTILWALAALYWKRGQTGATYRYLGRMLGVSHRTALRRAILKAEATGLVKVRPFKKEQAVSITPAALKKLEETWKRKQ